MVASSFQSELFESLHGMLDEEVLNPVISLSKDKLEQYGLTIQQVFKTCEMLQIEGDRLYFNPKGTIYPFCYWDGFFYKDFLTLDPEALLKIEEDKRFSLQKQMIHDYVQQRDWNTLVSLVDKKVSFQVLSYVMQYAPDEDHTDLFLDTYTRNEYGFDRINQAMARKALSNIADSDYSIYQANIQPDVNDYYTIYRGVTHKSSSLDSSFSWTLDKDVAKFFATRFNSDGLIYTAKIHKDKVRAYIPGRNEQEVLVFPEDIIMKDGERV
jgi:hypothetical protein